MNTLQDSLNIFQLNFPYTRLIKYDTHLVFTAKGDLDYGIQKANSLIKELALNLVAEKNNSAALPDTIIIKSK